MEVSGRKGLGVKADDLLDTLIRSAGTEVGTRNPELGAEDRQRIAQMIAIAAVRYFMIKFSRGKVIAFDLEEALSFEGKVDRTSSTRSSVRTTSFRSSSSATPWMRRPC